MDEKMVVPFERGLLNPASLDVRLGDNLMIETMYQEKLVRLDISGKTEDAPYLLMPGHFRLAETREFFNITDDISCRFVHKSSRARDGVNHLLAGWIDPGFHGSRLTLELKNERRHCPIRLWPGLKIGQIVFHCMSNVPQHSYAVTGHYNNHATVMPSVA